MCEPVSNPNVVAHQSGSEGGVECFAGEFVVIEISERYDIPITVQAKFREIIIWRQMPCSMQCFGFHLLLRVSETVTKPLCSYVIVDPRYLEFI